MSLLADMLSKAQRKGADKRDVPPELTRIIARRSRSGPYVRFMILSAAVVGAFIGGYMTVSYLTGRGEDILSPRESRQHEEITGRQQERQPSPHRKSPQGLRAGTDKKRGPARTKASPARRQNRKTSVAEASGQHSPAWTGSQKKLFRSAEMSSFIYTARQYEAEGRYNEALSEYRKALSITPTDPLLLNAVAYLYLRMNAPATALEYTLKALKTRPGYVPAIVNAGISYAQTGDAEKAEIFLQKAVELDPLNREALYNLALLLEKNGRTDDSLSTYRRLAESGDYDAYIHVGRMLELSGRTDEAVSVYRGITRSALVSEETRRQASRRLTALQEHNRQ